jgi:hypothetical protein
VPFQAQATGNAVTQPFTTTTVASDESGNVDATAATALAIGLAFLAAGAALDRRHLAGAATPFVAVGALEAIIGAVVLGADQGALVAGLAAMGAGAVVGIVGGHGQRRASTWIGALVVFGGLVTVLVDIGPDSAGGVGAIAVGFAAALGVIAWWLAPRLGEPDDGDEASPGPTLPAAALPDLPAVSI